MARMGDTKRMNSDWTRDPRTGDYYHNIHNIKITRGYGGWRLFVHHEECGAPQPTLRAAKARADALTDA